MDKERTDLNNLNGIKSKGLIIFQTWHTVALIIVMFIGIGILYANTKSDIEALKEKVRRYEKRETQLKRLEYNLRRLLEKEGMEYKEFGEK